MKLGYGIPQMFAYLLVMAGSAFILDSYLAISVDLLLDKNYYNIDRADLPVISSQLNFNAQFLQIGGVLFSGFFYDLIGRRFTIIFYLLICAVSAFFSPYPAPDIYPFYFICKAGVTLSIFALFANPLLNDYITVETRPRIITLSLVTVSVLGII